jgi:hypothetical protein
MESYIVRIYRRNTDDPQEIIGLVEIVGMGTIFLQLARDMTQ